MNFANNKSYVPNGVIATTLYVNFIAAFKCISIKAKWRNHATKTAYLSNNSYPIYSIAT